MKHMLTTTGNAVIRGSKQRQHCLSLVFRLFMLLSCLVVLLSFITSEAAAAVTSVTPSSWNTIGLDSNTPAFGPSNFPAGAKVCGNTAGEVVPVTFHWDRTNPYVSLRPGSFGFPDGTPANLKLGTILTPDGYCADAMFEVVVTKDSAAFTTDSNLPPRFHITAGSLSTPTPRELYVEKLISQGRNAVTDMRFGTSLASLQSVPNGGSMSLVKGNTYFIQLIGYTATQGYEQLEAFINFDTALFQILSVSMAGTAGGASIIPALYADPCKWENDPNSPNYRSCTDTGKFGGNITVTYEVKIIEVTGASQTLSSLIHDFSGSSFHYNADYSTSARFANLIDPATARIEKSFSPSATNVGGISTLTFTLSNPNAGALSGLGFTDVFPTSPGNMTLSDGTFTSTCGGTLTNNNSTPGALAAGNKGIILSGATVAANGTCIVQVNVNTDATGSYTNTSQHLFVNSIDTGDDASASLTVSNTPPPPSPPSTCTFRQSLAAWTMEGPASAPPAYSSKAANVSTATASFVSASGVQSITNNLETPNLTYAWGATAPTGADGWSETPTSMANYFQFVLDTSKYGGVSISFDGRPESPGNWANPYSNVYINTSSGGAYTVYTTGGTPLYPRSAKDDWTTFTNIPAAATGTSTTTFRIGVDGSGTKKPGATYYLDNVTFTGCLIPDPPTMTKSFTGPVAVGGTSTLTFTITNPNVGSAISGIAFTDNLPQRDLQGKVDVTNGSPTVTAYTGSVTAFKTQLVAGSIIFIGGASYTVSSITSDTSLTLTGNFTGATATNQTITAGLTLSSAVTTPQCGGTMTGSSGGQTITLAGGTIAAGAGTTCTITASVKDSIAGPITNVSGAVSHVVTGTTVVAPSAVATATLTAILPPIISKKFTPNPILANGTSTLTFMVSNPNQNNQLSGVAFADTFPTSPANMTVVNPLIPSDYSTSGCGSPTFSPVAGAGSISFSGGTIAAGTTCTVTVKVTASSLGSYANTSGAVSATTAGNGNTASDTLVISAPHPAIGILKEISASNSPTQAWGYYLSLPVGNNVYYQLSVYNDGDVPLSGVTISDPNIPALSISGCSWKDGDEVPIAYPLNLSVANNSNNKDFAYCILAPVTAVSGVHTNTATASVTYDGTVYTDTDWANYATTGLTLAKSATQSYYTAAGNTLDYSYLVTNSGSASLPGPVTVTDDKTTVTCPAVTTVGDFDNYFDPGESLTCTATAYTVTAADVTATFVTNTATAKTPAGFNIAETTSNASSKTVWIAPTLTKAFAPGTIAVGLTSTLTFTITNPTGSPARTALAFTDTLPGAGALTATTTTPQCGGTVTISGANNNIIGFSGGSVAAGGSCTITATITGVTAGTYINGPTNSSISGVSANLINGVTDQTLVVLVFPSITVVKSVSASWDPINGNAPNAKAIPGATMQYSIQIINSGAGPVDLDTTVITDAIPANTVLCARTACNGGTAPVTGNCIPPVACGLTYTFNSDTDFSTAVGGGLPYDYFPSTAPDGYDTTITGVRFKPKGTLNGASGGNNSIFNLLFKVKIQ